MDEQKVVDESAGYLMLGMYEDAWEFIESLPAPMQMNFSIMGGRLACAMALRKFELAEELALLLAEGPEETAKLAAQVLQELATIHLSAGDSERARNLLTVAINAHPAQQLNIIHDPTLSQLF